MKHQGIAIGRHRAIGDDDAEIGALSPSRRAGAQPAGAACLLNEGHRATGEQCGGNRLDAFRVGDPPARRRLVERKAEPEIAGRRDRGVAAQRFGQRAGQRVGAVVPAEQWHRDRAVLGERDDRRLDVLVVEQRRDRADQNAARA